MEIKIPFNEWSIERLENQLKKATSRYKKYGNVGDIFIINGYRYELELVIKVPLWFVAEDLFKSEGAESSSEFIQVWKSIHKRKGYRAFDMVWYHHFKELSKYEGQLNMKCSGNCGKELGNDWILRIKDAKQYCKECSKPFGLEEG